MLSFYQKLASKLNDGAMAEAPESAKAAAALGGAASNRLAPKTNESRPAPAEEPAPEGTDSLDVDLFQSESRMVVFIQMSGVSAGDFEITADEELNTLTVQATQKRPNMPSLHAAEGAESEKGRLVKQEIKWKTLYRKIYLPTSFKSAESEALLERGVLIVVLPVKRLGVEKKLAVKEILDEKTA
ncbi:MAG TPA: Hsp20/alpha crystallin family protein [Candidatus Paceibacterota bacterium]|nr:Hsp20/alpha crystallin family protein [Candidatus Paceibacterota bacterium]